MAKWTTWCWAGASREAFGRWAWSLCFRCSSFGHLAPLVSDVKQYHWPSLGAHCFFGANRKWRTVTGGGGLVGSYQSGGNDIGCKREY